MYTKILNKISQFFLKYELLTKKKTRNYINQLPSIIKKYANTVAILIFQD